jgi:hypothetical protein
MKIILQLLAISTLICVAHAQTTEEELIVLNPYIVNSTPDHHAAIIGAFYFNSGQTFSPTVVFYAASGLGNPIPLTNTPDADIAALIKQECAKAAQKLYSELLSRENSALGTTIQGITQQAITQAAGMQKLADYTQKLVSVNSPSQDESFSNLFKLWNIDGWLTNKLDLALGTAPQVNNVMGQVSAAAASFTAVIQQLSTAATAAQASCMNNGTFKFATS